jgi:tripeptide aminopeptidase
MQFSLHNGVVSNPVKYIEDIQIEKPVLDRFLKYVRFWTTSDHHIEDTPSTPGQWDLAKALVEELQGLGIHDVELTDHCYVIARLPASTGKESAPAVGFLAHLDTASDVSGKDVKPQLVRNYDGTKIRLAEGLALDPAVDTDLTAQKGKTIVHTDGTTLLGADDKAGIAEIVTAVEILLAHPEITHGPLEIIFSPDEETGKGLPDFPLEKIKAAACYTLDGGPMGEIEIECFTAWKAVVEFTGKVIHIGTARGVLANAVLMAANFATLLPRSESPEATDGYYGYYCPMEIKGTLENAGLEVFLRDFSNDGMKRRLAALELFAKTVEAQFPGGKVTVNAESQYSNMREKIELHPEVLEILKKACLNIDVKYRQKPIRGGTDGAKLTTLGIPTPNIFTGGRNYLSRLEWVSVNEMCTACRLIVELARLWGKE